MNQFVRQTRGTVVVLLSNAFTVSNQHLSSGGLVLDALRASQAKLADIADMIHASQKVHRQIVDMPYIYEPNGTKLYSQLKLRNTLAVLVGDFLLANASRDLARLRKPLMVELIAKAISNMSEAEFLLDEESNSEVDQQIARLEKYCYLSSGSLLGHSCKSALFLADGDDQTQAQAFEIGKHIGIAFRIAELIKSSQQNQSNQTFKMSCCQSLLELYTNKSLSLIENLQISEFSRTLSNIVINLK